MARHSLFKATVAVGATVVGLSLILGITGCFRRKGRQEPLIGPRVINGVQYGKLTVYPFGKAQKRSRHRNEIVGAALSDPKTFNPFTANETSSTDILDYVFEGLTTTNGVTAPNTTVNTPHTRSHRIHIARGLIFFISTPLKPEQ